ncbi:hypothetical protein Tco_0720141, partial [Tanacetum coccineum]
MMTTNQGLSFAEIKQIIAQQVANTIETIAIYETKTHVARDLMNKVDKMAENASNMRKWKGDHAAPLQHMKISPYWTVYCKVMAAPIIFISSEESVGFHAPRVILFGVIPAIIPVIPEVPIVTADPIVASKVGKVSVVSPAGILDLVDYSFSSDSDPSKDSLPLVQDLPLVSPFLCSDDSEADDKSEPTEQRPERHESLAAHDAMVSRWRDRVASRPSSPSGLLSHDTLAPSSEFPLAPIVAPPRIRRIRPFLARRLAWIRVSHHSSDRHSSPDASSSGSSLVHSPGCSSSERSLDLSSPFSRPPRKRCRSSTTLVPSPTHVSRSITPTLVGLLPPRKRFRDSYSLKDSGDEHIEVDTANTEAVADDDKEFEAEAHAADTREIAIDPLAIDDS